MSQHGKQGEGGEDEMRCQTSAVLFLLFFPEYKNKLKLKLKTLFLCCLKGMRAPFLQYT